MVLAWGDPLFVDEPDFNLDDLTPASQERRFGFNADFVMFLPMSSPTDGLLWINHEYTDGKMMFVGYDAEEPRRATRSTSSWPRTAAASSTSARTSRACGRSTRPRAQPPDHRDHADPRDSGQPRATTG